MVQVRRIGRLLRRLAADRQGAAMVEYALIISLVAAAIVASLTDISGSTNRTLAKADAGISGQTTAD